MLYEVHVQVYASRHAVYHTANRFAVALAKGG